MKPVPKRWMLAMAALAPTSVARSAPPPQHVASTRPPSPYDRLPPTSYDTDAGEPDGRMPEVGACFSTRVVRVTTHLPVGRRASRGTEVHYRDGHVQVSSYDRIDAAERSRRGDPISLCVVSVPAKCPAGDFRGVMYRATDLRTRLSWVMRNALNGCGGA